VAVSTHSFNKAPAVYRRNLYLLTFDYVFFALAMTFTDGQTVMADFVGRLSGSEVLVGLIGILFPLGVMLPQLAVAPAVARSVNKRVWVLGAGMPGRSMMFVIALGIAVLGVDNPTPVLVLVLVGYGTFAVCDGISAVGWMDLIARVLPNERRGRLYGRGRAIASLLVLLFVSNIVRDVLDPQTGPGYPNDYVLLFALTGVCLWISIIPFFFVREQAGIGENREAVLALSFREYFVYLQRVLRYDHHYRRYLLTRIMMFLSTIAAPFYIRYATERLNIPSEIAVSRAILLSTLGMIVGGPVMGWLCERFGSRLVIWFNRLFFILQPLTALAAVSGAAWPTDLPPPAAPFAAISELVAGPGMIWPIYLAFFLTGLIATSSEAGALNWIIEYASDDRRAIYYSLTNAIGLIGVLAPVVGGVIAEAFSFKALFVVALALSLIAMGFALRLAEPRAAAQSRALQHLPEPEHIGA
jgi:MFS family permease